MRHPGGYMLVGIVVLLACGTGVQAATKVSARVQSNTAIYPGQMFTYSIIVEGGGQIEKIDLTALDKFHPQPGDQGTQTFNFNGQGGSFYFQNYGIVAGEPGTMVLPGVTVVVGGTTYTTNSVEVAVSKPGTTDRMTVEFSVSPTSGYVGQPFVMKVRWTLPATMQNPDIDVPVFRTDDFYFEDAAQTPGSAPPQQAQIAGVPVTITAGQQLVRGIRSTVISFSKVLIPKRPGKIVLNPVTGSADIAVGQARTDDFLGFVQTRYQRFSTQSQPVALAIQPMPEAGKPAEFYGLVGHYTIDASATPTKVNVGDPITLTIRVGGSPYLKPVQWPELEKVPGMADNFKIPAEEASPTVENGEKVFTQTLRATRDSVTEIPAIPLAYFDADTGRYATARTKPIPLNVAPTKVLTNADVQGMASGPVSRQIEAMKEGFAANYDGPDMLVGQSFSLLSMVASPPFAATWFIPLAALVASMVYKLSTRTSPEAIAAKRRRQACGVAVRRCRDAKSCVSTSADPREAHDRLTSALKGYLGDRFDRTAGSLTADECRDIVAQVTGDAQIANRFRMKVSEGEAARYASIHSRVDSPEIEDAINLIRSVETKAKQ